MLGLAHQVSGHYHRVSRVISDYPDLCRPRDLFVMIYEFL